jgi:hypothetical protein
VQRVGIVQAEDVGWGLTSGTGGLSRLSNDEKNPAQKGLQKLIELSTMSHGSTEWSLFSLCCWLAYSSLRIPWDEPSNSKIYNVG